MMQDAVAVDRRKPTLGAISLVMGLAACVGVTAIWLVSSAPWFGMPGWLRIVSGWAIPVGLLGAVGFGVVARVRRSGVGLSTAGLVFASVSVIEFVAMILANPY